MGDAPPMEQERWLGAGWRTEVHERDGVVYRSPKPQSATVLAFLRHLEAVGFPASPRVVGDGFAPDGREALTFIEGEIQHPATWGDDALATIGRWLATLHAAAASFVLPPDATWRPSFARDLAGVPDDPLVIGHGDLGPWNILARHGRPVAFIDWDDAGPVHASWELAQVAWLNVQLHDDDIALKQGLADVAERARQLRILVDAYGLDPDPVRRRAFVGQLAEFAIHEARQESIDAGITEDSTDAVDAAGYPVMWAVTWRARSASWILRHRAVLEAALV